VFAHTTISKTMTSVLNLSLCSWLILSG